MERNAFPRQMVATIVVAVVTAFLTTGGILVWAKHDSRFFAEVFSPRGDQHAAMQSASAPASSDAEVVGAVKKANPAVVAITISKNVPVYEQYYENVPSPFSQFFGNDFFNFSVPRVREKGTEKKEVGGGSGFLVSSDGYIVTNKHVVEDTEAEYTVFTNDGKKYTANVVARDPVLDLAVIKINTEKTGSDFSYLTFGDSDKLEVGQSVIAIGNALAEFRNTVSVGVISGLSRSIVASDHAGASEALDQLIQTDAAINPGNSGGPLLDRHGDVIGVNVAIASGAQSIGFALSGNSVKSVVESVKKNGRIVRAYLGVRYAPITPELKEKNGLPVDYGVLVERGEQVNDLAVIPGSPADKAGIVENDIILEIDGKKLTTDTDLAAIIRGKNVGDTVDLKVLHKSEEKNIRVTLEEMK
jgi:S1-C subfamily serine protease